MFMPSGTMCNQVALATHCRPGDEVLAHEDAHIQTSEAGGPGAIAGVMIKGLHGERGIFSADTLQAAIRPVSRYSPPQTLVEVEQTANKGGGACWKVSELHAVGRGRACAWHEGPHGRRSGAERSGGAGCRGAGRHGGCRYGVARFHQGPGCAAGCGAGGTEGFHRPGLAVEAAAGRIDAAGRDERGCLYLRAATQHRPAGRGSCQCGCPGPRHGADPGDHGGDAGNQSGLLRHHRHRADGGGVRREAAAVRRDDLGLWRLSRTGLHASGRERGEIEEAVAIMRDVVHRVSP